MFRQVGNYLNIEGEIRKKDIFMYFILTFLIPLLKLFIDSTINTYQLDLTDAFYAFFIVEIIYVYKHFKSLKNFFRDYFNLGDFRQVVMLIFNIIVLISFVKIIVPFKEFLWGASLIAICWFFSGILQTMLRTKALYVQPLEEYMKISKIYAFFRLSSYFLLFIGLQIFVLTYPEIVAFWPMVIPILSIPLFLYNLTPYFYQSKNVENTIAILRLVRREKLLKEGKIIDFLQLDENWTKHQLVRLLKINLLTIKKKRYCVTDTYE